MDPTASRACPRQLIQIAGNHLPPSYRRKLERYRYGCAAFKLDWALDGPIPWIAEECQLAATVHLGGTMGEIVQAENAPWRGEHTTQPFVLLTQPSLFDSTRVPAGKHTVWAYCHVANGSDVDMTEQIENQIERFAPGFRDRVLARHIMTPAALERHNANLIRWRYQRWRPRPSTALLASDLPVVCNPGRKNLPVFFFNAAGRRRSWDVRLLRGPDCPV